MEKQKKRALRRHHRERMKARARRKLLDWGFGSHYNTDWDWVLGVRGDTFTCCSCHACGNPRHWFAGDDKIAMAERRMNERCRNEK